MTEDDPHPTSPQLLTANQLAERWQVPRSHVYRLTRTGQVPTVRIGRYYRYRLDIIEAFEADLTRVDRTKAA